MNTTTEEKYHSTSTGVNNNEDKDEVDFVPPSIKHQHTPKIKSTISNTDYHKIIKDANYNDKLQCSLLAKRLIPGTLYGDCEMKTSIKSSLSTLEKIAKFNLNRKRIDSTSTTITLNQKEKHPHRFVKSASLAKLLGNTYNTKKSENDFKNSKNFNNYNKNNNNSMSQNNGAVLNTTTSNGIKLSKTMPRRFSNSERFQKCTNFEDNLNSNNNSDTITSTFSSSTTCCLQDFRDDDKDYSMKAFRTISRSLGKLLWKKTHSIEISTPDPEYKVSYLGNVLTGWAKGEGCVEKPLNTLWRNYTQNHKPDVIMRIRVCASGLKATTRQHGLTEYWSHRITYCCSPKNYPRVFCWIYRHEGRKLKHELRCHAVLCNKESVAQDICNTLRENLDRALRDFKREKISKQNARLSLANAVYENPSLPRRKILLSVGGNNYRPPLERSKSAPKLMAIEEAIGEEEEDGECEQTNEPELKSCCAKDSMYPAMTLGRRRCRRGHSIRRTGKGLTSSTSTNGAYSPADNLRRHCIDHIHQQTKEEEESSASPSNDCNKNLQNSSANTKSISSLGSDDDDFEKLLSFHNYDTNSPLAGELLSYFDMKMKPKTTSLTNLSDEDHYAAFGEDDDCDDNDNVATLTPDPKPRTALSLDNLDSFSGIESGEEGYDDDDDDDVFYRQAAIINLLQNASTIQQLTDLCISTDENESDKSFETHSNHHHHHHHHEQQSSIDSMTSQQRQKHQQLLDSDEGSISSGCETASTVTANMDDSSLKYCNSNNNLTSNKNYDASSNIKTNFDNIKQISSNNHNNVDDDNNHNHNTNQNQRQIFLKDFDNSEIEDNKIKISSKTINFVLPKSIKNNNRVQKNNKTTESIDISDSEFSDESGYVEFQEQNTKQSVTAV